MLQCRPKRDAEAFQENPGIGSMSTGKQFESVSGVSAKYRLHARSHKYHLTIVAFYMLG